MGRQNLFEQITYGLHLRGLGLSPQQVNEILRTEPRAEALELAMMLQQGWTLAKARTVYEKEFAPLEVACPGRDRCTNKDHMHGLDVLDRVVERQRDPDRALS